MERRAKRRRLDPKAASDEDEEIQELAIEGIDTSETENESSSNEAESDEEADEDESSDDDVIQQELAEIDFGTLAKAQKSLSVPSSSTSKHTKPPSRLKPDRQPKSPIEPNPKSKSKNAPQELSSKKPVSRKHFLHLPTSQLHKPRDPRFDTLNNTVSEPSFRNAYSFLDKYQRDEINVLKEQIRNERDSEQREKLKKTLQSLQSRREGRVSKERAEEVLRQRKKEERDKVAMGKKPFYLKKSEEKKLVLEDKYSRMGKKRLEKVLEKKRKKKEGKELRRMPKQRQRPVP